MVFRKDRKKIIIMPYRGYASPHAMSARGRVLEDELITIREDENLITTLRNAYKRFESDEIPLAGVEAKVEGQILQTVANKEGYFHFDEKIDINSVENEQWKPIHYQVTTIPPHGDVSHSAISATGEILVPSSRASFGIISDIDDTVLKTDVSHRLKLLRNTLLKSSFKRLPLPGIPQWLQALRMGPTGDDQNPVFYLSKSPRNIYDYLEHFLELNHCPKGPILLRDIGWVAIDPSQDSPGYKRSEITQIMNCYPDLPFVFLGDIAGKDPEIYHSVREEYPDRVLAIYIRDIRHKKKQNLFRSWKNKHQIENITLIQSSLEGVKHSVEHQLISPQSFDAFKKDQNTPTI